MSEPVLAYAIQAARRTIDLGNRLLVGIKPEQFARLPVVGGQLIRTNHPAFIYGHLSLYPAKIMTICGLDSTVALPPEGFEDRFRRESPCHDDPAATIYPPMAQITQTFFANYDALLTGLPTLAADTLAGPNPDPRLAATFPTVGSATIFLLCNHVATHMGQVSSWRRCMGLPPA